ncbi:hypothetical protein K1T71_006254 [Dendrolimus kikuchii]|uniref:Uncharacterized protein n=1 Tax=Dendrolimus kikuchii TaxID=765133 RepID=A0ACC1D3P6_9NEOP|nr:hypothetical protein K1T71_006254 [Dendrolimus kikuchii]
MDRSLSNPELHAQAAQIQKKTPPIFVTKRLKKKREDEINSEKYNFEEDLKAMITSLMASQNEEIRKNSNILNEIKQSNYSIEKSVSYLTSQNEELKKKIEQLETQVKDDKKYITILEDKIEDIQKSSIKTNFVLKNVPKLQSESKEDLISMTLSLAESIGCTFGKADIRDIYRIRPKKADAPNSPIVVESSSTLIKQDFLKLTKAFNVKHKNMLRAKHLGMRKSEDTPVFVADHLTAKGSRLYFLARDLIKSKTFKFCWTAYGKVYIRKDENARIILIKNEAQIQQLLQHT